MTENLDDMKKLVSEIVGESYSIGNITSDHLKFGMTLCNKDVDSLKTIQENAVKLQKMIENLDENILPRPVIRDGNEKLIKEYTQREWYLKLQEEIYEAFEDPEYINHYEVADIITVCISYLNALGYNKKSRSEIFRRVNEKNEKRGYFEGDKYLNELIKMKTPK